MLERDVESKLKWLEGFGFKVLKLRTPGYNGTKDRLILHPKWAPAPPSFLETKAPGKEERALQEAVREDWRARGCHVLEMCDTPEKVRERCSALLFLAVKRLPVAEQAKLPTHILTAFNHINKGGI